MKISVITPTYNRAYILPQCYKSLCEQTIKDFEWIIVDDGSTDYTEQIVKGFLSEAKIVIKYYRQNNGGKHRAHNNAVTHATGELTVCLDSDDQLAPNAIEKISEIWREKVDPGVIGILALRGDLLNHRPICSSIPKGLSTSTLTDLRDKYRFKGDTVLFFDTQLLKSHPFREFEGEKFLTEVNLYCDLDQCGPMLLLNQVLYYCEYRNDGLTAKYHKLLFDNATGAADTYYRMTIVAKKFIPALKYSIIANVYSSQSKDKKKLKFKKKIFLMALGHLIAPIFKKKILSLSQTKI